MCSRKVERSTRFQATRVRPSAPVSDHLMLSHRRVYMPNVISRNNAYIVHKHVYMSNSMWWKNHCMTVNNVCTTRPPLLVCITICRPPLLSAGLMGLFQKRMFQHFIIWAKDYDEKNPATYQGACLSNEYMNMYMCACVVGPACTYAHPHTIMHVHYYVLVYVPAYMFLFSNICRCK